MISELQFLNKVIETSDSSLIEMNSLDNSYFPEYKKEFDFIKEHLDRYHQVPDKETFLGKFPDFKYLDVKEPDSFLLQELINDRNQRYLASSFNKVRDCIMKGDVDNAMEIYRKGIDGLKTGITLESVDILHDKSRYEEYLEKTKDFNKYFVKTGFPELDKVIGGWDRTEELATIVGRSGFGKCLEKGTTVLMADGSLKKVEDIKVGDKVQSYNRINTVLALHNGVSKGYKIIPNRGESFIISENHILTLMELEEKWNSERKQSVTNNIHKLIDITIEDYLKLSNHRKAYCKLFYPTVEYETKQLDIDPYILGLWLGDGTSRETSLTTMDKEVADVWCNYGKQFGLHVNILNKNRPSKAITYYLGADIGHSNPLLKLFRKYDLVNNKHIPLDYLTGDRQQRLELLAGLLDSDGSLDKEGNGFEITFKSKEMIEQTKQLAVGLGLRVGKIQSKYVKAFDKTYYRISINGDLKIIPLRVSHKIPTPIENYKRKLSLTGFKVEPIERVEYYGFMCDGDQRYILGNGILTHNTWILLKSLVAAAEQGLKVGLYSGEMTANKVGYRLDTLISHISNGAMVHGNGDIKNEYKDYIDNVASKISGSIHVLTPTMIDGPAGVKALGLFIDKEKLDILFIDQHSLLEDDRKAKNPIEKAANISKDLKNLQVMKKIPIISVSQQNRVKNEDSKGNQVIDLTLISQSDRIGQDSTTVLFIERKDDVMRLHLVKSRDSENGKVLTYRINLNKGTFEYSPDDEDALQGDDKIEELHDRYEVNSDEVGEEVF